MKNLSKCQETMIIQQGNYYIICTIKIIVNLLILIYEDQKTQASLNKLISLKLIYRRKAAKAILNFPLDSLTVTE